MKKKILIISHAMELGGVERSLLGLLDSMDYDAYDVDLFLLRHEGELLKLIPPEVNILPEVSSYTVLARPMQVTFKEGHLMLTAARLAGKIAAVIYSNKHHYQESIVELEYSHKYTKWLMPKIQPDIEYDLAISFLTPHYFVAEKVNARKKAAWIHTDYTKVDINRKSELKMWNAMDYIVSISDSVTTSFLQVFPTLQKKIILVENLLPKSLIEYQAVELDVSSEILDDGAIKLLTIGRFSHPKNIDGIPGICKRIRERGVNVKWYIIGYGGEEPLVRQKIMENHMEEFVIILGKKENPYPYIKACDLYVQPSRYEGKSVTVREAQMLGKPVVITNYATSASQFEDGVDGIIVPMDNEGCVQGIVDVLHDTDLQERLIANCEQRDYSNSTELEKIYRLIENED